MNRQAGREGKETIEPVARAAVTLDALASETVATREDDRADAFRALVGEALDSAYRRAAVLLGNRFEAEDAVHDAAERAWRSWGSLRDDALFEAWFGRILINVCRDRLRRRRRVAVIEVREASHDTADPAAGTELERVADRARVLDRLAKLSVDERLAIVLRFEGDMTIPQIASLTGARAGTIKSRLHNALRKLRTDLEPGDDR